VAVLPQSDTHRGDHLLRPADGGEAGEDVIDLTCAAPSPGPGLLRAYERAGVELVPYLGGTGYYPSGLPALRELVAAGFSERGVATTADQILIIPGALAGLAVAARALLSVGDRVVVESPTYPNAIAALTEAGARVVGVDTTARGWDPATMAATIRQSSPRLAYLIPDFHNPTGAVIDDEARRLVAMELDRSRTTAVVDESMLDVALDEEPMPRPFAAHAADTITLGSMSKGYWGGLRVGWIRAPRDRMDALVGARLSLDLGTPVFEQLVAIELLRTSADTLAHRRTTLRASRDAALEALATHLPDWRVTSPRGGLSLWCELPESGASALAREATRHGVLLTPGPAFAPEGGMDRYLRVPYALPPETMRTAVSRIAAAWRETLDLPKGLTTPRPTLVA
jgi:DNA-binding transcriptional MocR family regulator